MKTIQANNSEVKSAPTSGGWWMYQRIGWRYDQWDFVMVSYEVTYYRRMMDVKTHALPEVDEPGRWIGPIAIDFTHGPE